MKLPFGVKLLPLSQECVPGLFRPRPSFKVSLKVEDLGVEVSQYVIAGPVFLRIRIRLALWRCSRMVKKIRSLHLPF